MKYTSYGARIRPFLLAPWLILELASHAFGSPFSPLKISLRYVT